MTAVPPTSPLEWAAAVTSRGYAALHPTPELPRPGALQQAAAVREAFAPAAPLLAARATGGSDVEAMTDVRTSDAAFWFAVGENRAVAVVPPFQGGDVVDEIAGVALRLPADRPVLLVVPAGAVVPFQRLAARLPRRLTVAAYRASLFPEEVAPLAAAA